MDRHALVVAVLVLLAGCGGFGSLDPTAEPNPAPDTTPTSTPTATPTATQSPTATPTPTPESTPTPTPEPPASFAPGVTEAGIADAGSLLEAHTAALLADGFVTRTRTVRTGAVDNVTVRRVVAGPGASPAYVAVNRTGTPAGPDVERYDNGTAVSTLTTDDGDRTYEVADGSLGTTGLVAPSALVELLLSDASAFSVTDIREPEGTTVVTLRATLDRVESVEGAETTASLVVTGDGLVREFEMRTEGDAVRRNVTYRVESLGATPETPGWVGNPPTRDRLDTEFAFNLKNSLVRMEVVGGDALPAGSVVTLSFEEEGTERAYNLTTAENVTFDEVRWLSVDKKRGELQMTEKQPDKEKLEKLPSAVDLRVTAPSGADVFNGTLYF